MPKRRTKKRIQKGGSLFNPFTWFEGDTWGGLFSSAKNTTSNLLNSANSAIGTATTNITSGAENALQSATNILNTDVPLTQAAPTQEAVAEPVEPALAPIQEEPINQNLIIGGKRRYKKTLKGGKGLGLTYYATPVSNMKVAEPTYWEVYANGTNQYNIKGGSKKKITRRRRRKNQTKKMKKH